MCCLSCKPCLTKRAAGFSYELGTAGQSFSYKKDEKLAVWTIPKMNGASAVYCRLKLTTSEADQRNVKKDMGPISMEFEVPMYVCSGLNIRFLRVTERGRNYVPFRWVRYITHRYGWAPWLFDAPCLSLLSAWFSRGCLRW